MLFADFWDNVFSQHGVLIVVFSSLAVVAIVTIVVSVLAVNWRLARVSEHVTGLKRTMVERGLGAEEIERIVRAEPVHPASLVDSAPGGRSSSKLANDLSELAGQLVQVEIPANQLEEILNCIRMSGGAAQSSLELVANLAEGGANGEQILAALRAIYRPLPTERPLESRFTDEPASFRQS
jgi:hypothetical protein